MITSDSFKGRKLWHTSAFSVLFVSRRSNQATKVDTKPRLSCCRLHSFESLPTSSCQSSMNVQKHLYGGLELDIIFTKSYI